MHVRPQVLALKTFNMIKNSFIKEVVTKRGQISAT